MTIHETCGDPLANFFQPAEVTSAFLKMGLLGFQGSGKTKTASKTATGLVNLCRERGLPYASRPAVMLDTETGSDWVIPDFKAAGIPFSHKKTRAFTDLLTAVDAAEAHASVLIIDSITHFWKEITESYMRQKKRTRLQFEDWGYLKSEWGKFTDRFVNSSAHIILCGRAGFEYDYSTDEETGKKNLEKTGVKMKAEGEMGYEPSLLVLMERQQDIQGSKVVRVWRTATVLKDRSTLLDGQEFEDPGFENFLPHIQLLNLGGRQLGVDTSRTSDHMIKTDKRDWQPVQRRIVLDEIQTLLVLHVPGQAANDKQRKAQLVRAHFKASWTEMEEVMPLIDLRSGYDTLHQELEGAPSRYRSLLQASAQPIDDGKPIDSLPDHSAPATATEAQPSLEDKLTADLANLTTIADCLHWGAEVSKRADLDTMARLRLSNAVNVRMAAIAQASEAASADPLATKLNGKAKKGSAKAAASLAAAAAMDAEAAGAEIPLGG
jgi:AAA domain-containing protein